MLYSENTRRPNLSFAEYEKGVATIPEDRKEVAGQLLKKARPG